MLLAVLLVGSVSPAGAEEESAPAVEQVATPEPTPTPIPVPSKETPLAKRPPTRGLFYGYVWDLHDASKSFVVKPINKRLPNKRFYADSKTTYRQEKKKVGLKDVYIGDKVAVRYFTNQGLAVADALFVVEGKFGPTADYLPKKKKVAAPAAAPKKAASH